MRWWISAAVLLLPLVVAACAKTAAAPAGPPSRSDAAAPVAASSVNWQRPTDVAPLAAEGKFNVISEAPWPGDKVRVFFFGVQE